MAKCLDSPLTTDVDNITATKFSVTFNAVTGETDPATGITSTLNTGDVLAGLGGTNTLSILGNGNGEGADPLVQTSNIQSVTVRAVADTSVDQLLMGGVQNFASNNSLASLTVDNAQLSTVYGLNSTVAGQEAGLNVNYQSTAGKTDTAQLSISNAGNKSTATTTQNIVLDGSADDSIEGVSIATAGTNYVTVDAGAGVTTFTLTGSGANTIEFKNASAAMKIDASATTGANTLKVGGLLGGSSDTVIGGQAADTLVASMGTSFAGTITDVETLDLAFAANQSFNASKVTGASTLDLSGAGVGSFSNLAAEVDTVKFDTSATSGGASLSYVSGTAADVSVTVGKTTTDGKDTTAITVGSLTFANNSGVVTVSSVADKATTANEVTTLALGTAKGLVFNADKAVLTNTTTTGSSVTSLEVNAVGAAATLGGFAKADALATIALTATGGNVSTGLISADDSLTTITLDAGLSSAGAARTVETSVGKSETASSKAVSAALSITGEGNSNFTTVGSDTYISTVTSDATGASNVNLSAYTGSKASTITLGDASTGSTNVVWSGSGDDVITGGSGVDQIRGGKGADIISGGTGADVYQYALGKAAVEAVAQVSKITVAAADALTWEAGDTIAVTLNGVARTYTVTGADVAGDDEAADLALITSSLTNFINSSFGGTVTAAVTGTANVLNVTANTAGTAFTLTTAVTGTGAGTAAVAAVTANTVAADAIVSDSNVATLDLLTFVNGSDKIGLFNASNTAVNARVATAVDDKVDADSFYIGTETTLSGIATDIGAALATQDAGTVVSFMTASGQVYAYVSDGVSGYSANGDVVVLLDNLTTTTGVEVTSNVITSFLVA